MEVLQIVPYAAPVLGGAGILLAGLNYWMVTRRPDGTEAMRSLRASDSRRRNDLPQARIYRDYAVCGRCCLSC
jgi:hypothetical protein